MLKIWTYIRHNPGITAGCMAACVILLWTYGCQSKVVSIVNSPVLVTRSGLDLEVDHFLKSAELRYTELDQQDEFKRTFFAIAMEFIQGGRISPAAIALTLSSILGLGAMADNIKKGTHIKTLKGGNGTNTAKT